MLYHACLFSPPLRSMLYYIDHFEMHIVVINTTRVVVVCMWFENQNMMKTMLISSPSLLRGNQPLLQLAWKLKIYAQPTMEN
jgi:hypothetical protein